MFGLDECFETVFEKNFLFKFSLDTFSQIDFFRHLSEFAQNICFYELIIHSTLTFNLLYDDILLY